MTFSSPASLHRCRGREFHEEEEVYSPGQAGRSVIGEVIKDIDRKDYGASVIYPKCDGSSLESFEQGET